MELAEAKRARILARRYLRFGTRSTAELRAYLQARDVPAPLIDSLTADCSQHGLLDDRACALLWANSLADRGYAWAAVREQLCAKGLEAKLIEAALKPLTGARSDVVRARELAQAQAHKGRGTWVQRRTRVARALGQRGFNQDLIEGVLEDVLGRSTEHASSSGLSIDE